MKYYYELSSALIGVSMVLVQSQVALGLSASAIEKIAEDIIVRIVNTQNSNDSGSGILIKRSENTYIVLTAYHVVKSGEKYQILTPDGQSHPIKSMQPLPKTDLAVLQFSSSKTYNIAKIGNSDRATATTTVYVAGFSGKTAAISNPVLLINKGQVNANGTAQRDGYNIFYENYTLKGMSGGAVLNEQGEVVAVHGRVDEQAIGIGTTIYSAARQMLAVGVDLGVDLPSTNVASAPKADDFYIKAEEKYRQKDYKGAIADYSEAIRLNPNYAYAYNNRGNVRSDLGDNQGAIADYNAALKINPNNPNNAYVYNNRGNARRQLGDKQGAIADFNAALKINPNNPNNAYVYNNRGYARYNLGDNQGAIADFNAALKINPNLAYAYKNRGLARSDLGDNQGAIADYNAALKINPNDAEAYYNRGKARYELGDKQGAIVDLKKAAEILRQQGNRKGYQDILELIRKYQQ